MTLARILTAAAVLATITMAALFAAGVHVMENGDATLGAATIIAGMLAALPVTLTGILAIEAHQFGTLS